MRRKDIKQGFNKLLKTGKKDLDKIIKDTSLLVKKGEASIKKVSSDVENNLGRMAFSLQREKLYYELGKSLSVVSKDNWRNNKKIEGLLAELRKIKRGIKKTN